MPVARSESSDSRIIAHVDMDCFYVQVEQRKQPHLRGKPTAVVQYNNWKGGGLIAVSYEARKYGVKRSMRGDEAKQACPEIQLVQVPVARGKADLSIYRDAGSEVVSILSRKGRCERASIDEVYLDLTDAAEKMLEEKPPESLEIIDEALKSHILGSNENGGDNKEKAWELLCRSDAGRRDKLLACGAVIVAELRLQVLKETEFTCSAGIAHNKMLAKLVSGMNKPSQQTVVPLSSVKELLDSLPIKKMKQLGGKLGSSLQIDLGVNTVGDLLRFSEEKLQDRYGVNTGTWLWNISRGISGEEVEGRLLPKSHGSGKTFPGVRALKTVASVEHWLNELCEELSERLNSDLDRHKRIAHILTLHANAYKPTDSDSLKKFPSKSCPLRYGTAKIQEDALNLFQAGLREYLGSYNTLRGNQCSGWGITSLSVSAGKIVATPSGTSSITKYFHSQDQCSSLRQTDDIFIHDAATLSPSGSATNLLLCSSEMPREFDAEETLIGHEKPICDVQDAIRSIQKHEDPHCSSSNQVLDDSHAEILPSSCSGAEKFSVLKHAKIQPNFCGEETKIKYSMQEFKSRGKKRKMLNEKGTSILRFFQNHISCSSSRPEHGDGVLGTKSSSSGELPREGWPEGGAAALGGTENGSQSGPATEQWGYKIDEIDPAVVDELPREIQEELRAWLRPQKEASTRKRGSSIAHYFSPNSDV